MTIHLQSAGQEAARVSTVAQSQTCSIGRSSACSLQLKVSNVSRVHAEISYDSQIAKHLLTDLSSNGTYIRIEEAQQPDKCE